MSDTTSTLDVDAIATMLRRVISDATQALAMIEQRSPHLDPATREQLGTVGEIAWKHLDFIETHGSMTLGDSLKLRREHYGDQVQGSASLFGKGPDSGSVLYRDVPYGTRRSDGQPVKMTHRGRELAMAWKALQPND